MATYNREPINGGDPNIWGPKELNQNRLSQGAITSKLYDDSGVLKITIGKIGINTGSGNGVVDITPEETINIVSVPVSNWGIVTTLISGSSAVFLAAEISGANDPDLIPVELTGAYSREKTGYYSGNDRIVGIFWKESGGSLGKIINVNSEVEGYHGKTGNSQPVFNFGGFFGGVPLGVVVPWHKSLTGSAGLPDGWAECNGQTISDSESPYDGQTLPDLNGEARFLRGSSISGTLEDDEFQNYAIYSGVGTTPSNRALNSKIYSLETGDTPGAATSRFTDSSAIFDAAGPTVQWRCSNPQNNGVNGDPRYGDETRPINMSVVFIIKIK